VTNNRRSLIHILSGAFLLVFACFTYSQGADSETISDRDVVNAVTSYLDAQEGQVRKESTPSQAKCESQWKQYEQVHADEDQKQCEAVARSAYRASVVTAQSCNGDQGCIQEHQKEIAEKTFQACETRIKEQQTGECFKTAQAAQSRPSTPYLTSREVIWVEVHAHNYEGNMIAYVDVRQKGNDEYSKHKVIMRFDGKSWNVTSFE
jgi:hypothetical protein